MGRNFDKHYEVKITNADGRVSIGQFVEYRSAHDTMAEAIRLRNAGVTDTVQVYIRDIDKDIIVLHRRFE